MINYTLNLLVPGVVIICCVIFGIFNLYLQIRKRFPVRVNCWFCNKNSHVPYESFNSFICSHCQQFNGFLDDGGYNREIPEQHYSVLNSPGVTYCQKTDRKLPISNGLCEACNRNQEMKIIQLSNFKPRCEFSYDEEIEEYRQKLEDSYQLCRQCTSYVNKTLNRMKTKFIGSKFSPITGKQIVKNNSETSEKKSKVFDRIVIFVIVILSLVNLTRELEIDIGVSNNYVKNVYFHLVAVKLTIAEILLNLIKKFNEEIAEMSVDGLSTAAIAVNFYAFKNQKPIRLQIVISLMLWSLSMLIPEVSIDPSILPIVKSCFAGSILLISLMMLVKSLKSEDTIINQDASFHKINNGLELDESDSELEVSQSNSSFGGRTSSIVYSPSVSNFSTSIINHSSLSKTKTYPILQNHTAARIENRIPQQFDLISNRSFSIRDEVVAADRTQVQNKINKLNISEHFNSSTSTLKDFNISRNMNPFSLENSRCGSPSPSITSVFSGASRTQIVSPPRLESSNKGEANWIAGGYWSSPQKQIIEVNQFRPATEMSRSSSQSSGLGTIDSDKNSRENSIINDEITSLFSEPVRRRNLLDKSAFSFGKPPTRPLFEQSFAHPQPNSFFSSNSSFKKYRDSASFYK